MISEIVVPRDEATFSIGYPPGFSLTGWRLGPPSRAGCRGAPAHAPMMGDVLERVACRMVAFQRTALSRDDVPARDPLGDPRIGGAACVLVAAGCGLATPASAQFVCQSYGGQQRRRRRSRSSAMACGTSATASGTGSLAIGNGAAVGGLATGAVAIGTGSVANAPNTVSFGTALTGSQRRLVNVADGVDDDDAVTVRQYDSLDGKVAALALFTGFDTRGRHHPGCPRRRPGGREQRPRAPGIANLPRSRLGGSRAARRWISRTRTTTTGS